jgi:site-specific recombinase XerD
MERITKPFNEKGGCYVLQQQFDLPMYAQKFLRHLRRQNYSIETLKGYENDLKRFAAFLEKEYGKNLLTEEIQKEDLLDYLGVLEREGLKPNSVSRNLSTLKSFYKFLVYEMDFKIDVAARIKQPKIYTPIPEILDFNEVQLFLKTAEGLSDFYHVFFSMLYYTGSRLTPIRTLLKKHIDSKNGKVYFSRIKRGRDLYLPLNNRLKNLLDDFLFDTRFSESPYLFPSPKVKGQPISPADVRTKMKQIAKAAGIDKRITPHILRHCTATHLTLLDVDQKYISRILGHTDLRSTARYQQLNVENIRPAVNKLCSIQTIGNSYEDQREIVDDERQ